MSTRPRTPREGAPTFPLHHRLERALWTLVWSALGVWTPTPLHGWRRFLLRAFGARISPTSKIYPGVHIWYPKNLEMHEYSCLGPEVNCYCMAQIVLEPYALVSQRAHLCAGSHDVDDPEFPLVSAPILVCRNAWIAAEAFVGPGVTVGQGAVLGARAVTVKNLESWKIYAGNPAKPLRSRTPHG